MFLWWTICEKIDKKGPLYVQNIIGWKVGGAFARKGLAKLSYSNDELLNDIRIEQLNEW